VKDIIGGPEYPRELPLGQRKQLEDKAAELSMEVAYLPVKIKAKF
jgi:hypothetical protein